MKPTLQTRSYPSPDRKRLFTALLWTLPLMLNTNQARAAESADLVVQVTAVTGSCTPSLDTPVVDLGQIQYTALNPTMPTALPQKSVRLTISCSSPMAVGWTAIDNRGDSVARLPVTLLGRVFEGTALAGLGKTPAGTAIGNWTLSTGTGGSVQYDGTEGVAITSADQGASWQGAGNTAVTPDFGGGLITTVTGATGGIPVPFSTGVFTLGIGAVLVPRDTLKLIGDTPLDGSVTLSLVYL